MDNAAVRNAVLSVSLAGDVGIIVSNFALLYPTDISLFVHGRYCPLRLGIPEF
jgi:arginine/lysine/ornithine decarboxylase